MFPKNFWVILFGSLNFDKLDSTTIFGWDIVFECWFFTVKTKQKLAWESRILNVGIFSREFSELNDSVRKISVNFRRESMQPLWFCFLYGVYGSTIEQQQQIYGSSIVWLGAFILILLVVMCVKSKRTNSQRGERSVEKEQLSDSLELAEEGNKERTSQEFKGNDSIEGSHSL
jgi:hypothetical protein